MGSPLKTVGNRRVEGQEYTPESESKKQEGQWLGSYWVEPCLDGVDRHGTKKLA
jgi:hypothetical protein